MACIGSLAAFFVAWAKYDEQKKLTKEERDRRWDEISRAVGLENEIEHQRHVLDELYAAYGDASRRGYRAAELQDKLSALLCPHNNHVWVDGCCVKCGRVKDD